VWRWVAVLVVSVLLGAVAVAQERSDFQLVAVMHQNLAAINEIQEAVVRDDYKRVAMGASKLKSNAESLGKIELASLGLDPSKGEAFDEYLSAQTRAADSIAKAVAARDAAGVLLGVRQVFDEACVACHADFRESDEGRTPPVLFMRSLLSSVQSVNRGIAMDDFALVAREAREIGAIAHILTWTQVIESMFRVKDPAERAEFRSHFQTLSTQAIHVERAATERDARMVSEATERMLKEGCVACHDQFRKEIKERSQRSVR
jgi:cytochrome c556